MSVVVCVCPWLINYPKMRIAGFFLGSFTESTISAMQYYDLKLFIAINNLFPLEKMTRRLILLILPLILIFSCASRGTIKRESRSGFNPLLSIIGVYREKLNHFSAVKASECPMYPSCSSYSIQCFKKHGFFTGWMMTCDRLVRCGRDELKLSPKVMVNGRWKCYDPVGNNDFWWYEK